MSAPRGGSALDILFLNTTPVIGGTNRVIQSLVRGCAARGVSTRFAIPDAEGAAETLRWLSAEGVGAERSSAILPMEDPHGVRDIAALRRFVRRSRASVVSLHYGLSYISLKDVVAARLAARRVVASVHFTTPWSELGETKRKMTAAAARLCNAVVVTTPALAQIETEAGIARGKLTVIPCGAIVRSAPPARAAARRKLGISPDAFVVACVCRLVAEKRVTDVVEAVAELPGAALVVAGGGPEDAGLRRQAADRLPGRGVFLGPVTDPTPVYAAADAFALAPDNEGFGIVFCEAALQGVPSVATHVGGIPYVVADGVTGLLVPPRDTSALGAALRRLQDDAALRRRLGDAARARALVEFTEEAMVERYLHVLGVGGVPKAIAGGLRCRDQIGWRPERAD